MNRVVVSGRVTYVLLALLFDNYGDVRAAAPACDQQPLGRRYWQAVHPVMIDYRCNWETAYLRIDDHGLANRLLWLSACGQLPDCDLQSEVDSLVLSQASAIRRVA